MLSCTCFMVILFLALNSVIHVIQYNIMAKSSGFKVRDTWLKMLTWKRRTNRVMRILLRNNSGFGEGICFEKEMATHSSILAWRIPWTEEFGGLQSMGRKESDMTERLHFHFHF